MNTNKQWSMQEEQEVRILIEDQKIESWAEVAAKLNMKFKDKQRIGKQCRERYINFIRSDLLKGVSTQWTSVEEEMLLNKYEEVGSKWKYFSTLLIEKSQNSIKNKFYGSLRKFIRKVNELIKNEKKCAKMINYETVIKILESHNAVTTSSLGISDEHIELRRHIIRGLKDQGKQIDKQKAISMANNIQKYRIQTRYCKQKRKGLSKKQLQKYHQANYPKQSVCEASFSQKRETEMQFKRKPSMKESSEVTQPMISYSKLSEIKEPQFQDYDFFEKKNDEMIQIIKNDAFEQLLLGFTHSNYIPEY